MALESQLNIYFNCIKISYSTTTVFKNIQFFKTHWSSDSVFISMKYYRRNHFFYTVVV